MTEFHFDRTWVFPVPPDHLWDVVSRTGDYRSWWPWLRDFDAPSVDTGVCGSCVIQSPLPYALRLDISVERSQAPSIIETYVRGDLDGPARLEIAPDGAGSTARLV